MKAWEVPSRNCLPKRPVDVDCVNSNLKKRFHRLAASARRGESASEDARSFNQRSFSLKKLSMNCFYSSIPVICERSIISPEERRRHILYGRKLRRRNRTDCMHKCGRPKKRLQLFGINRFEPLECNQLQTIMLLTN